MIKINVFAGDASSAHGVLDNVPHLTASQGFKLGSQVNISTSFKAINCIRVVYTTCMCMAHERMLDTWSVTVA